MRILTSDQMRWVDRQAIEVFRVPSLVLMENAALGVVEAVGELFPACSRAAVVCGPGNNGGDGLAVARQLATRGVAVEIFLAAPPARFGGDAGAQLEICRRLGLPTVEGITDWEDRDQVDALRRSELVLDALFGTGLSRPLAAKLAGLVEAINRAGAPVLAVDLPSGLDASRGELIGPSVRADATVSFAAPKVAHIFAPAADRVGRLVVSDLGIPADLVEAAPGKLSLLVADELAAYLAPRPRPSHKGSYGHLLVVAGSLGKSGAAVLTCRGALRSGAGLVTAAVPAPLVEAVEVGCVEAMTEGLQAEDSGELHGEAGPRVRALSAGKTALAVGPGLGTGAGSSAAVRQLLSELSLPAVVDADGLNAFAPAQGGSLVALASRSADTVLTPHPGELARLLETTPKAIQDDRMKAVQRAAELCRCVVVLKGHQTLVTGPDGELWVNPTGNPGMATGGSGDVLTGVLGGLLAQGFEALAAAQLAVFVHGLAGDLAARRQGELSLVAGDLVSALAEGFAAVAAGEEPSWEK